MDRFKKQNVKKDMDCDEYRECENEQCLHSTTIVDNNCKVTDEAKKIGVYYDNDRDEYICGHCMEERIKILHFCVNCKKEFRSKENIHYEEALCKECDALEKEGEQ